MGGEHEEDAWGNWGEKAFLNLDQAPGASGGNGGIDEANGGLDGDGGKGMGGQTNPRKNFGTMSLGYHWRPGG